MLQLTTNGRPVKFTPERLEQIKNLVERGMAREQIAETIGVTLGSLQVTCSRLGISLRRPRPVNGGQIRIKPKERVMDNGFKEMTLAICIQYRGEVDDVSGANRTSSRHRRMTKSDPKRCRPLWISAAHIAAPSPISLGALSWF